MNTLKVVDASALTAILFDEERAAAVAASLDHATLIAPVLLDFELANACLMKIRRNPTEKAVLLQKYRSRDRIVIALLPIDPDAVLTLAEAANLTAYDASYLWLAQTQNAELVTLDKKLAAASSRPR